MDKSSSLGMSPGHPKKYPRSTSVKAWGCPRHPLFINKKHQVIFQYAIFLLLHILCVVLGASLFLFSVCFVLFAVINSDHIIIVWERDTLCFNCMNALVFTHMFNERSIFARTMFSSSFSLFLCSELFSSL